MNSNKNSITFFFLKTYLQDLVQRTGILPLSPVVLLPGSAVREFGVEPIIAQGGRGMAA